ncbi:MAG: hypothetical protein KME57_29325 [Scytonema hyalinum WJT4-NPBG1]|nr:hypothetical protein [Scytonema hyalinum WJT4-NPBG1]
MTVAGAAFTALLTVAVAPVQAAPLDFNFTTETGATGSFTLNTDTLSSREPGIFGPENPGILYSNAVSNFSFSSPQLQVSGETADWEVIPSIFLGPPGSPVLAGVDYPAGCASGTNFTCVINIGVGYAGNLPKLSDDPNSYPSDLIGLGVMLIDPITRESVGIEEFTQFQVVRKQVVPESDSGLGVLAFGIALAGLLLKRNLDRKKQVTI